MKKMDKLIIFDLDGTLVNSIYDLADAVNDSLVELGYPVHNVDKYYRFVGDGTLKLAERALPESLRSEEEINKLHKRFSQKYQQCCLNKTKPYNGMVDALYKLKQAGIKCAVASNKPDKFAKHIVDCLFGEEFFDMVIGKRDNVPAKPDPQIIFDILDNLNIEKKDCLLAGDSDVDVITAHNSGIRCIGCAWGFRGEQELTDAGADFLAFEPIDIVSIADNNLIKSMEETYAK